MEIKDVVRAALGDKFDRFRDLNDKVNVQFLDLTKEEAKEMADLRKTIQGHKARVERLPKLEEFRNIAAKLKEEHGFSLKELKAALDAGPGEAPTKSKIIVGKFDLKELGITGVTRSEGTGKNKKTVPVTDYQWDFSNSPKGQGWDAKLVAKLKEIGSTDAGWKKLEKSFTPEFKQWLGESRVVDKGQYKGKTIKDNARAFYGNFGRDQEGKLIK